MKRAMESFSDGAILRHRRHGKSLMPLSQLAFAQAIDHWNAARKSDCFLSAIIGFYKEAPRQGNLQQNFFVYSHLTIVSIVVVRKQEEIGASRRVPLRPHTNKDSNRTFPENRPLCTGGPCGLCRPLHPIHRSNRCQHLEVSVSVFVGDSFQPPTTFLLFCSVLISALLSVGTVSTESFDRCLSSSLKHASSAPRLFLWVLMT